MTLTKVKALRGVVALLAATAGLAAAPSFAQRAQLPPGAVVQPLPGGGRGAELRRHLRTLADNPRSLSALVGAARAAVALGDHQAALTFANRALTLSPRDPQALAVMGSVLIHMEQPQDALRYFGQAAAAGAPEAEIARDRGLAHDAAGNQARAQADYNLALRSRDDPELRRRLALSLAISGQRAAALRTIADQLARRDRAALRVQAFVLALTGDAAGAAQAARAAMPGAAGALTPFLARLPSLTPAQRAMAVHFGRFPVGAPVQIAAAPQAQPRPAPSPPAASRSARTQPQPGRRPVTGQPVRSAERRNAQRRYVPAPERRLGAPRPLVSERTLADQTRTRQPARTPQSRPRQAETSAALAEARPRPAPQQQPVPRAPTPRPQVQTQPEPVTPPAQVQTQPEPVTPPAQAQTQPQTPPAQPPSPEQRTAPAPSAQPAEQAAGGTQPGPAAPRPSPAESRPGFDEVAALVSRLPTEEPAAPPPPEAQRPQPQPVSPAVETPRPAPPVERSPASSPPPRPAPPAAARERTAAAEPPPAAARTQPGQPARETHPSRHWVQIAGGADRTTLPREFARLREQAPALFRNRTGYVTPLRATNRLLVGPFPSFEAAQEFVNQLARQNLAAFAWTSPAGQEIERLPVR